MADSFGDILKKKQFSKPSEIDVIKDYVLAHFEAEVGVTMHDRHITIEVPNAALAASLRMQLHELQKLVGSNRRLSIRIS